MEQAAWRSRARARSRILVAILLAAGSQNATAFLGFGTVLAWDEDVLLQSGQVLAVSRTMTFGPEDAVLRSRPLKKQTIAFVHHGQSIRWTYDVPWSIYFMPFALHIVNDEPVVFMPIHRGDVCAKYGYPQDGLIAFRFRANHWELAPASEFPGDLRINLATNTHAIEYYPDFQHKRIDLERKRRLERSTHGGPGYNATLAEAVRFYSDLDEGCARIRPAKDLGLGGDVQRNLDAQRAAPVVVAEIVSFTDVPETVTKATQDAARENYGSVYGSCQGVVARVARLQHWTEDAKGARRYTMGKQLELAPAPDGRKIPLPDGNDNDMTFLRSLECSSSLIFVIRRVKKEALILNRFTRAGDLVDVFHIALPEADRAVAGREWGFLWAITPDAQGSLRFALVDLTNERRAESRIINRKTTYRVALPPRQAP
jgi:hypothetical protein